MRERDVERSANIREILVVEDHEATAEMVTMLLEDQGYKVTWVNTAGAAIEFFAKLPTDTSITHFWFETDQDDPPGKRE